MKEEKATIPGLPNEWSGQRIALIADLQIGMWFGNQETDRRIVDRIIQEKPALVLIAGDFVYKPTDKDERDDLEREDTHAFREEVEGVGRPRPAAREGGASSLRGAGQSRLRDEPPRLDQERPYRRGGAGGAGGAGIRVLENAAQPLSLPNDNGTKESSTSVTKLYLAGIGRAMPAMTGRPRRSPRFPPAPRESFSCIIPIPLPYRPERRHSRSPAIPTADRFASPLLKRGRGWRCRRMSKCTSTAGSIASANAAIVSIKEGLDEAGIDMPYDTQVQLFHDQTEAGEGDRSQQREGWPAAKEGATKPRWKAEAEEKTGGESRDRENGLASPPER